MNTRIFGKAFKFLYGSKKYLSKKDAHQNRVQFIYLVTKPFI